MEHRQCVVDSSIFVAFYAEADADHDLAVRLLDELKEAILIVHPYVIQEVASVLCRKYGYNRAVSFLNALLQATNVIIPAINVGDDITGFVALRTKISFTDAALIRLAKQLHVELVTFDKQMMMLAKKA